VLEIFKIGIGPSSSHTLGPMVAARDFITRVQQSPSAKERDLVIRCCLKGSLAFTGKGHSSDSAVLLGLHGYRAEDLCDVDIAALVSRLRDTNSISLNGVGDIEFSADKHIQFDKSAPLAEHPNGMIFELLGAEKNVLMSETYFSIGGGFIQTQAEITKLVAPLIMHAAASCPYPFDSAKSMLKMAEQSGLSIAEMKMQNESSFYAKDDIDSGLRRRWQAMQICVENGLHAEGHLPGGLHLQRRAKALYQQLQNDRMEVTLNDWLSAYAMAVNEENAAGHMVVTAPTNGAAGVIPAVLYYFAKHKNASVRQIDDFLLTASAIGGIIKHRSSISGAEVGCHGEVGSAAAMAAAGLCAALGGTPKQIENAAEIALEHHLGMTCDPVNGLVQVPCIERNAFGAIKAHAAAMLALRGSGTHFMPLDNCIAAMKQTGQEMSEKYKETALGGLAVNYTEC